MALAVLGAVALAGCTADVPTHDPTSSGTRPPAVETSSATPTPSAVEISMVTVDPLLPEALPLTEGLLAETDPGWLIVRDVVSTADGSRSVTVEYLVSPSGERYELPDHPGWLMSWQPGTPLALVDLTEAGATVARIGLVDLETGAITPVDPTAVLMVIGQADDDLGLGLTLLGGRVVMTASGTVSILDAGVVTSVADWTSEALPSPDGRWLVLGAHDHIALVDALTLASTDVRAVDGCDPMPMAWLSTDTWFAGCIGNGPEEWAVYTTGGDGWIVPQLPEGVSTPVAAFRDTLWLFHRSFAPDGTVLEPTLVAAGRDGTVAAVDGAGMTGVAGGYGSVVVGTTAPVAQPDWYPSVVDAPLIRHDLRSGAVTTLVPAPDGGTATVVLIVPGFELWLHHRADGALEVVPP